MSGWQMRKLGEVCSKIGSGATPRGGKESYKNSGIPLIRSQNVLDFAFSNAGLAFIDDRQAQQLENVTVQMNDVLINITGDSVARVCMAPEEYLPARVNQHVSIVRVDSLIADPYFILYFLQQQKGHLLSIGSSGGTRNALTKRMLEELLLPLPDISTQRDISATLSALDNKIANNTKINHHLEQMAQAIFAETFGSVLRPTAAYAAEQMGNWLRFVNGFAFKSLTYLDVGKYKIITIKNVQDGSVDSVGASCIDELPIGINPACVLSFGDVLLSLTGNVGRVGIVTEEDLLLNQRVAKFEPIKQELLPFWYFMFRKDEIKEHLINIAKGTAQQNLSPVETLKTEIVFDENMATEFSKSVTQVFWAIAENCRESNRLVALRDTLLPRLMSGELSVVDPDDVK